MSLALWNELWSEYSSKAKDYWAQVQVFESLPDFQSTPPHHATTLGLKEPNLPANCQLDTSPVNFPQAFVRALASAYYTHDMQPLGSHLQMFKSKLNHGIEEYRALEDAMADLTRGGHSPITAFLASFEEKVQMARRRRTDPLLRIGLRNQSIPLEVNLPAHKKVLTSFFAQELAAARDRIEALQLRVGRPNDTDEDISIALTTQRTGMLLERYAHDDSRLDDALRRAKAVATMAMMSSSVKKAALPLEEAKMVREHENLRGLSFDTLYNEVTTSVESVVIQDIFVDVESVIAQSSLRNSLKSTSDNRILNEILESLQSQTTTLNSLLCSSFS